MKVRKKPVVLDAIQFTGDNAAEMQRFLGDTSFRPTDRVRRIADPEIVAEVWDKLHSTWVGVKDRQWLMIGTEGESWPVDDAVFAKSYEIVDEGPMA